MFRFSVTSRKFTILLFVDRIKLADRINTTAQREAFVTLKDHKPNFDNNPTCRLINPSKSEIGRVSKLILDRINTKVIEATRINQWKNTKSVLSWFNQVAGKSQYSFIAFDVIDFYPSISIDLLKAALHFASKYDNITDTEREIVLHAKKSCLYNSGKHLGKKLSSNLFDVTIWVALTVPNLVNWLDLFYYTLLR